MAKTNSIPINILRQLLRVDPETGEMTWQSRPLELCGSLRAKKNCDKRFAGKKAFTNINTAGYFRGEIFGTEFLAHRVIWALATGAWPPDQLDHINGNRQDNRLINLREADYLVNNRNMGLSKRNSSGTIGVKWAARDKKWRAEIEIDHRSIFLGQSTSKAEAIAIRKNAEIQYGFHPNHGRK